ncbi:beta-carotene isomerase D27, chloroplastic-like [Zingiber officinale]|uniref:beta-carotene isomerase D27, chloroplastic-like n=1 Tax=Zingiber officinale TaxID=94328 RepID=UPI001C4B26B0|nr:beta-carotene isomerase D27, chloroplastic-like [Zingiber officinale]
MIDRFGFFMQIFPPLLLVLFKMLIAPVNEGKIASMMLARATAILCQWLMGPCLVNSIDLDDGSSCSSGVFVERCKYLEENKCLGVCVITLPPSTFRCSHKNSNHSTAFNFGLLPPPAASDKALTEPCLSICPSASRCKDLGTNKFKQCPTV